MAIEKESKCGRCGKAISDVMYIRYGGLCCTCWHIEDNEKKWKKVP